MSATNRKARKKLVNSGIFLGLLAWLIPNSVVVTSGLACCYESSPVEESTPVYDDNQLPDQIADSAPSSPNTALPAVSGSQQSSTSDPITDDGQPSYYLSSSGFGHHIKMLQAEGRQLEALMTIRQKLALSPQDMVATALLAEQMQKFKLVGKARDIYLSRHLLRPSDKEVIDDNLSFSMGDNRNPDEKITASQTISEFSQQKDTLKRQIGILYRGIELN